MYTDRDYHVKDRFHQNVPQGSIRTLYRPSAVIKARNTGSHADPGLYPGTSLSEITPIPHHPPGLEILAGLTKLYLIKRVEVLESDTMGKYTAEIIDEEGTRIFLITPSTYYDSDEVIQYGKLKKLKMKGKICFGVINYSGIQVFEIYGDPEKVIRVGPNSAVWGEIQVIPNPVLLRLPLLYCFSKRLRDEMHAELTEVRVVILRKDLGEKNGPYHQNLPSFKNVYTLRGKVYGGCCRQQDSILYKKSFDFLIFSHDPLDVVGAPAKRRKKKKGDAEVDGPEDGTAAGKADGTADGSDDGKSDKASDKKAGGPEDGKSDKASDKKARGSEDGKSDKASDKKAGGSENGKSDKASDKKARGSEDGKSDKASDKKAGGSEDRKSDKTADKKAGGSADGSADKKADVKANETVDGKPDGAAKPKKSKHKSIVSMCPAPKKVYNKVSKKANKKADRTADKKADGTADGKTDWAAKPITIKHKSFGSMCSADRKLYKKAGGSEDGKSDKASDKKAGGSEDGKSDKTADKKAGGSEDGKSDKASDKKAGGSEDRKSDKTVDKKAGGSADGSADKKAGGAADEKADGTADAKTDKKSGKTEDGKADENADGTADSKADGDGTADGKADGTPKPKTIRHKSIGRICSCEHHVKLDRDLPLLEIPQSLDVYDKVTLMGTFFLFHLT